MVETCIRCGRQAPSVDSSAYMTWEVTTADDLVCPDCAHPEERTNNDAIRLAENDER
jgi:DNA-directed RNA polymerase subunit RPC12/RpoP